MNAVHAFLPENTSQIYHNFSLTIIHIYINNIYKKDTPQQTFSSRLKFNFKFYCVLTIRTTVLYMAQFSEIPEKRSGHCWVNYRNIFRFLYKSYLCLYPSVFYIWALRYNFSIRKIYAFREKGIWTEKYTFSQFNYHFGVFVPARVWWLFQSAILWNQVI